MADKPEEKSDSNKGEVLVVPRKRAVDPDFFSALMRFQYGDEDESNAGFEDMTRQSQTKPDSKADLAD